MNQQTLKFNTMSDKEWDEIPVQKTVAQKPSPWDEVIEQLVDGKVIALPIDDEKELRGMRIGIARRASKAYDVKLAFKYDAAKKILAIRLASEKEESSESSEPRKRGRPAKKA